MSLCERNLLTHITQLTDGNGLPEGEALEKLFQMVHGMLALHRQGYLHGNLKLENVLVKGDELRLSDFELNGRIRQNCSEEFMVWQFL